MYYDGANLNATLGKFRPGDADFDVLHVNLHKTFGTPHGGGGPGAGPVGVKKHLEPYLPVSRIVKRPDNTYTLSYDCPKSIGYIAPFYGNFAVCLRAYAYIMCLGGRGLVETSENAVLNANYVLNSLKDLYEAPFGHRRCMHECVLSAAKQLVRGVHALDIAKGLIDSGFHPPTVYFPLIVKEAIMIEPTETESMETIDAFIGAMRSLAAVAQETPEKLHEAPLTTPVGRLDETKAVKDMDFAYLERRMRSGQSG
jgi:glycine dehydrogenase subunit 2